STSTSTNCKARAPRNGRCPRRCPQRACIVRFRDVVARALGEALLRSSGDSIIAACSNGPDSLALADALIALRPRLGLGDVVLAYVHHGLRPTADTEAAAVERYASTMGVESRVLRVAVDRGRGRGLEEAARIARFAALDELAGALGVHWIALGHTASDQAETLLWRLIRGAGPAGMAGIAPVRGRYLRPLLDLERPEVLAYLEARGLVPSCDESNEDLSFLRNRVRHRILPVLREENPRIDAALARATASLRENAEVTDWAIARAEESVVLSKKGMGVAAQVPTPTGSPGELVTARSSVRSPSAAAGQPVRQPVRLSVPHLASLPPGLAKQLLAKLVHGMGVELESRHLAMILSLARQPISGTSYLHLPRLLVCREYDEMIVAGASHTSPPLPSRRSRGGCEPAPVRDLVHSAIVTIWGSNGPFRVRLWQAGDRIRLAGLKGHSRKLHDLYIDRKVPRPLRQLAVVVLRERDGEIVWAEHVGPAAGESIDVRITAANG
ncbi:MAG: tRNA lysidine(34) synthetase TilS, partial [Pseudomonadota bacterium]